MGTIDLLPAGAAFDAIADRYDERFDPLRSVAAQRRAVRTELLSAFPEGARLLEIGGGTGSDAQWLAAHGRSIHLTDASPRMVAAAARKLGPKNAEVAAAEDLHKLARPGGRFDGAYSNFAGLNCVTDLRPVARALADLIVPKGKLILVIFGRLSPGEVVTEALRGRFGNCFRRLRSGDVPAQLGGRKFSVRYHSRKQLEDAFGPDFRLIRRKAVGLAVPPSAAEPWISGHPHLLNLLEAIDRIAGGPLAPFGDHVLYLFERAGAQ